MSAPAAGAATAAAGDAKAFGPVQRIAAGVLDVGYVDIGPPGGRAVLLLHGWPYDFHSYADVAPPLAAAGYRVLVPYLRGYGATRFLSGDAPRNGQQLAAFPAISVPTITLEGDANGAPRPEPAAYAARFTGKYLHRTLTGGIGHNLPQEAPLNFVHAIKEVDSFA